MRFGDDFLEDIRSRLPVSQVVGRRVDLKKRGREFVGLSPFNSEKTPSFTVNDQKGFYHCFSSGNHGDIFRFLMQTEGLSFYEAVERLANEVGLELPKADPKAVEKHEQRRSLYEVLELSAQYLTERLHRDVGAHALGYLSDRGISPHIQTEFGIGYAPDQRDAIKSHLADKGVNEQQMRDTGMLVHGEEIAVSYDRFRNRLMFPIQDIKGRYIGFGGRALSSEQNAKYLNSPETEIFHKGNTLYNIHRARQAVFDGADLLVAEGYMDVIALYQAGFRGAVAPLGTALTENQLGLLWRMHDNPCLCLDGDRAGRKAAFRALELALSRISAEKTVSFMLLPDGQDPDDILKKEGSAAFQSLFQQRHSLFEMLLIMEAEGHELSTPEQKASFEARMRKRLSIIQDSILRSQYERALNDRLYRYFRQDNQTRWRGAQGQNNKSRLSSQSFGGTTLWQRNPKSQKLTPSSDLLKSDLVSGIRGKAPLGELLLVAIPLYYPSILAELAEDLAGLIFTYKDAQKLTAYVLNLLSLSPDDIPRNYKEWREILTDTNFAALLSQMESLSQLQPYQFLTAERDQSRILKLWRFIKLHTLTLNSLNQELHEAEQAFGFEPNEQNQSRMIDLKIEIERLHHDLDGNKILEDMQNEGI